MSTRDNPLMELCAQPLQGVATVRAVQWQEGRCVCRLETAHGVLNARQAASCLLVPQPGDQVWLAGDLTQGLYVTAVLERLAQEPACVRLPDDASLEVAQGSLTLRADSLRLAGRQLTVKADEAALCADKLTGTGRELLWSFARVRLIADLLESFAERVMQMTRWSQRVVAEVDQVRAGHIDYQAEQLLQLQANAVVANARGLVKVDGEQIHIG